jgi:ammonia channel protein AmtB
MRRASIIAESPTQNTWQLCSKLRAAEHSRKGAATAVGLIDGHPAQVLNQLAGVAIAWVLGIVGSLVILKIVDWTVGLRVTEDQEIQGLDLSQHGEEGYNLEV